MNDLVAGKVERPHLVECREGRAQREQLVARQRQFLCLAFGVYEMHT